MSDEKKNARPYFIPPPPRDLVVGPVVYTIISILVLILAGVSLGVPWYQVEQFESPLYEGQSMKSTVTLWKTNTKIDGLSEMTTNVSDYCWPVMRRVRVIEAFACATVAVALACVILSVFNIRCRGEDTTIRHACVGLTVVTFVFATIACSFNFSVYYWSFKDCGSQSSYHSKLYEPGVGFAFMVTAWVLTFVAGLIVANNPTIPLDARYIDSAIFLFTLFSFIGVVFSATSTPIPHWFYKDGSTTNATDVTLWKTQVGPFDWDLLTTENKTYTHRGDYTCSKVSNAFFIAGAVSIAAASVNFVALFWGVLIWQHLTSITIPAIVFSILGFLVTVATFVIETIIYKNTWCDNAYAYEKKKYVLGPGYALCAAALVMMLFAFVFSLIAHIGINKFFPAAASSKTHSD